MGKSCIHFRQLADLGVSVLEQRIASVMTRAKQRCGWRPAKSCRLPEMQGNGVGAASAAMGLYT